MAELEQQRCAFVVKKRGRRCRMLVARGSIYCGEHLVHDTSSATFRRRVPCPLDHTHTVFEDVLHKHLKKCNQAKRVTPPCFSHGINAGLRDYTPSHDELKPLTNFSEERISELVARVEQAYESHMTSIEEHFLQHSVLAADLSDPKNGPSALKHLRQQSSILAHMQQHRLLLGDGQPCFVEFGAGRGKLSECVQRAIQTDSSEYTAAACPSQCSGVHYVLVDRASCRRKVDGAHRTARLVGATYHRLLMDISDLDLGEVECLKSTSSSGAKTIVAMSKHLCGAATDLTLRCLTTTLNRTHQPTTLNNAQQDSPEATVETTPTPGPRLAGIVLALCCHHRCTWAQLVGREFLNGLGFSAADFHLISHMTSWAVCGVRPTAINEDCCDEVTHKHTDIDETLTQNITDKEVTQKHRDKMDDTTSALSASEIISDDVTGIGLPEGKTPNLDDAIELPRKRRWGYVPHKNESIGLKCKRLIDLARVSYLEGCGFTTKLVYYVERKTSLENVLLIAIPNTQRTETVS